MTRWVVRVTWYDGMTDAAVTVEAYDDDTLVVRSVDTGRQRLRERLEALARSYKAECFPTLF